MNTKGLKQKMTPERLRIKIKHAKNMIDYYEKSNPSALREDRILYWKDILVGLKKMK